MTGLRPWRNCLGGGSALAGGEDWSRPVLARWLAVRKAFVKRHAREAARMSPASASRVALPGSIEMPNPFKAVYSCPRLRRDGRSAARSTSSRQYAGTPCARARSRGNCGVCPWRVIPVADERLRLVPIVQASRFGRTRGAAGPSGRPTRSSAQPRPTPGRRGGALAYAWRPARSLAPRFTVASGASVVTPPSRWTKNWCWPVMILGRASRDPPAGASPASSRRQRRRHEVCAISSSGRDLPGACSLRDAARHRSAVLARHPRSGAGGRPGPRFCPTYRGEGAPTSCRHRGHLASARPGPRRWSRRSATPRQPPWNTAGGIASRWRSR